MEGTTRNFLSSSPPRAPITELLLCTFFLIFVHVRRAPSRTRERPVLRGLPGVVVLSFPSRTHEAGR